MDKPADDLADDPTDEPNIQTQIIREMALGMHNLGAQSDLLSTVGSYGESPDEDVLIP